MQTTQSQYLRIQNEADEMLELLREIVRPFEGASNELLAKRAFMNGGSFGARLHTALKARAIIARIDGGCDGTRS